MNKVILVTGATGTQGSALIDALLSDPGASQRFTIVGVTRNATSPSAKRLKAKSSAIKVVQGDFENISAVFRAARDETSQPIWGVFSVQPALGKGYSPDVEERQGKALIDESIKQGVQHFVQTSVDRGGNTKSWSTPTNVPHFISKHNIELHLRDRTATMKDQQMTWTILRPVAFMNNIVPSFGTKIFLSAWREKLGSKPLQLVAAEDIGRFASQAFLNAESTDYRNQAIGLAGDELNFERLNKVFTNTTGQAAPTTFGFLGSTLLKVAKEMRLMINWFATDGFGVEIQDLRSLNPNLMSFEVWLSKKSKFVTNT